MSCGSATIAPNGRRPARPPSRADKSRSRRTRSQGSPLPVRDDAARPVGPDAAEARSPSPPALPAEPPKPAEAGEADDERPRPPRRTTEDDERASQAAGHRSPSRPSASGSSSENERKLNDYNDKKKKAEVRVKELNARFADWYYVVSEDVYKKIRLVRSDIVKESAAAKEEGFGVDAFRKLEEGGVKGASKPTPAPSSPGFPPMP